MMGWLPARLQARLVWAVSALLLAVAGFVYAFFSIQMERIAQGGLQNRAEEVTAVLADAVAAGLEFESTESLNNTLAVLNHMDEVLYAAVFKEDGTLMASVHTERLPAGLGRSGGNMGVTSWLGNEALQVAHPVAAKGGALGVLIVALSTARMNEDLQNNTRLVLLAGLIIVLIGVFMSLALGRLLAKPLQDLTATVTNIEATRNLAAVIPDLGGGEAGELALAFKGMISHLRALLAESRTLVDGLNGLLSSVAGAQDRLTHGAVAIDQRLNHTLDQTRAVSTAMAEMAATVEDVASQAGLGAGRLGEVESANSQVTRVLAAVANGVVASAVSLDKVVAQSQRITEQATTLEERMREAAAAVNQIDRSTSDVTAQASIVASLAVEVEEAAARGDAALHKTQDAVARIHQSIQKTSAAMGDLAARIGRVDVVLGILDEISRRTNILALNAGIIASQVGGESGRAFGVVADEVRRVALNTRTSTEEIVELLRHIHQGTLSTGSAMDLGLEEVKDGVNVSLAAQQALASIVEAAQNSSRAAGAIAGAAGDQAEKASSVASVVQRAASLAQEILETSKAQQAAVGSTTVQMRNMAAPMDAAEQAIAAQRLVSEDVAGVLAAVLKTTPRLRQVHELGSQRAANVETAARTIQRVVEEQARAAQALVLTTNAVRDQADELKRVMERFKG